MHFFLNSFLWQNELRNDLTFKVTKLEAKIGQLEINLKEKQEDFSTALFIMVELIKTI